MVFWRTVILSLVAGLMSASQAAEFRVGQDYEELVFPQPVETGKQIEVREFFWYSCPHCYAVEPSLRHWLKSKPTNAAFVRTPGTYLPWQFQGRVYYTFESLGIVDRIHKPMLDAIHRDKRKLDSLNKVVEFVAGHGVTREQFMKAYNSFGVRLKLKRAIQLNADFDVRGVPNFVVDGKYRTSPSLAKSEARTFEVIDFLIRKAARERK